MGFLQRYSSQGRQSQSDLYDHGRSATVIPAPAFFSHRRGRVVALLSELKRCNALASMSLHNIEEQLICAVCLEQYKDPRVLPCAHSFCKRCIEPLLQQGKRTCPVCRESIAASASLPANFLLSSIIDAVKSSSLPPNGGSTEFPCDLCSGVVGSVSGCRDCGILMCKVLYAAFTHFLGHALYNNRSFTRTRTKQPRPAVSMRSLLFKRL